VAGFDPKTDIIADNYDAGAFLIYDCKEKHWTCVTEEFYTECKEKRSRDLASLEDTKHSCAPIGSFPTKRSCFQRQLFLTTHNHGERFCVKDEWKSKSKDP
jgi:hypothetical protein